MSRSGQHEAGGPGAATRLLVLGAVMIFQPVHGYFLRRELTSWDVDQWANIHPGSIYNALRGLTDRGLLEEASTEARTGRPARTAYRLTTEGEQELMRLLQATLRTTEDPTAFLVAVNLAFALPRAEVISAMEEHVAALHRFMEHSQATAAEILTSPETPDYASEIPRIIAARTAGELAWATDYLERIRSGEYEFRGEPRRWFPTDAQIEEAMAGGAEIPDSFRRLPSPPA
jgi:DNA-binding PadR family transcriptional regulator